MSDNLSLRIYLTYDSILIHNQLTNKAIAIDRSYLSISNADPSKIGMLDILKVIKSEGILGIIQIGVLDFLFFIKSSIKIGNIGNTEVFEITEIDYILMGQEGDELKISKEIHSIINGIKQLSTEGLYYSRDYDLTNSLQHQKKIKINNNNNYDIIKDADPSFFWNFSICHKFFDYGIDNNFLVNCISGFVSIVNESIHDNYISYILISRRRTPNAGTRANKRGMNENGHVANYVETEQIFIINNNIFSFVQLRGTPPVFYNKNYKEERLNCCFNNHMQSIFKNYKLIFVINLMNSLKENELALTNIYEKLIRDNNYKNLKYFYYDVDNEALQDSLGGMLPDSIDNIDKMLNNLENIFNIFKYFGIYNIDNNKTIIEQVGIIRTNCYDGLERTNLMQMRIAWKLLTMQLQLLHIDPVKLFGSCYLNTLPNVNNVDFVDNLFTSMKITDSNRRFINTFKRVWADNGIKLSLQYAGAKNLSVNDINVNYDMLKQRCIDIFLQKSNINFNSGNIYVYNISQ